MLPRFSRLKGAPTSPFDCNLVLLVPRQVCRSIRAKSTGITQLGAGSASSGRSSSDTVASDWPSSGSGCACVAWLKLVVDYLVVCNFQNRGR